MKPLISIAFWLMLAAMGSAMAAGPPDLAMTRGALVVGDQVLFVSDGSGDPCKRPCSAMPFLASPDAIAEGLWTLAPTEEGAQWVYDGARLYLWPEIGANHGRYFFGYNYMTDYYGLRPALISDVMGEGFAISVVDPRIARRPFIERRTMAAYNLANAESGTVIVTVCVDHTGSAGPAEITSSSGSASLDADALEFASIVQYQPARDAAGEAIAVCGMSVRFVWPEQPDDPVTVAIPTQ